MKKYAIIANCQGGPLQELLKGSKEFSSQYENVPLPSIQNWAQPQYELFWETIADLDLVIAQPLLSPRYANARIESLREHIDPDKLLVISNIFFEGYYPTVIHMRNVNFQKYNVPIAQCGLILGMYMSSVKLPDALPLLKKFMQTKINSLGDVASASIQKLSNRERTYQVDIRVGGWVRKHFRERRMMHSLNHPSNFTLRHLCNSLLRKLGIQPESNSKREELLGDVSFPIFPNVADALNLNFNSKPSYTVVGKTMNVREYIEFLYNFYSREPVIARENFDLFSEKIHACLSHVL
jgi:hypothetical protein